MTLETTLELEETTGPTIKAVHLNKWVRKDLNLLQDISLVIQPNEFVVVVGQSGGGKSTLIDALAGYRPATEGQVFVNDVDVYKNFDEVRNIVGYVPQRDIIHMELSVYQALDYAARLRMPPATTKEERHVRIIEVLGELDLVHRKDVQVSGLSGGQQKRVSIGVELLTRPRLFFLDEPTSGLDPGTEASLMQLMRRMASQGRTIVLITHSTKNIMLADKVVFLARGGFLAWYGPPREALDYFDVYRNEDVRLPERPAYRPMEFDDIYGLLEESALGKPADWAERYRKSDAHRKYIDHPLSGGVEEVPVEGSRLMRMIRSRFDGRQVPPWKQFIILSQRNVNILVRDRASLILMLLAAPAMACLDHLIAPMMGRDVYDPVNGVPVGAVMSLFLLTLYALMVASLSQMREIVKEQDVYRRERLVFLRIGPYILSKIWVALLLAAYQGLVYTGMRYLAFHMPGGRQEFVFIFITLFLTSMAAMMMGLFASAVSPNAGSAPMITIMLIIPSVVLSGALVQLPPALSAPSTSYWAFKSLVGVVGVGSDVMADPCWHMPDDLVRVMSIDDKEALGCRCMGVAAFDPNSCNFPGTGKYAVPEIYQTKPAPPTAPGDPPGEPVFPDAPPEPADPYDKVQVAAYLNSLQGYQAEIERIRSDYQMEFGIYQLEMQIYQAQMTGYQRDLAKWYVARSAAIGSAEGNIHGFLERFGWSFVNKEDVQGYAASIQANWAAQGVIIGALLVGIFIAMKIKDRK